jgi:hypothetical protein
MEKEALHHAIDGLMKPESLRELSDFVAYLHYKERKANPEEGSTWLKDIYDSFEPVREEAAESGMTEEEINAFIDEVVEEVRTEHYNERIKQSR